MTGRGTVRTLLILVMVTSFAVAAWITMPARPNVAEAFDQSNLGPSISTPTDIAGPASTDPNPPVAADPTPNLGAATDYAARRGLVALAVIDRQTGTYLDNGAGAHIAMGSASVIKVVMAEELLYQRSQGDIELGSSELALMETMLKDSNDGAASRLYSQFGGVSLIMAALSRHQLTESGPPADPQYWGNTMVTAHDVAAFYNNLLAGSIPPEDRDHLIGLLGQMAPVAADGFGQLFGVAGVDPRPQAAVKQGWMCCLDDVRNVHSTAVLGQDDRYILVILTQYSPLQSWEYGQGTATEVARLILSELAL